MAHEVLSLNYITSMPVAHSKGIRLLSQQCDGIGNGSLCLKRIWPLTAAIQRLGCLIIIYIRKDTLLLRLVKNLYTVNK